MPNKKPVRWIRFNPAQILVLGFLCLIAVGTFLLMLPISTQDRHHLSLIDALFEATSAVCVTGLVVVDTKTTFTLFGQTVLMFLIQIGGLGFMTFGILIALSLKKSIGMKERLVIQASLNQLTIGGMVKLVKFVLIFTFIVEGLGALLLTARWESDFGLGKAMYYGLFHSISAFNNAGFDLMGNYSSMTNFAGDPMVVLTLTSLVIIGGIGFFVIYDILNKKSFRKFSLHTKIALYMTIFLILFGTISILALEYNNPGTLGELSLKDKLLAA